MDTAFDRKFPDDQDSASVFSKVIGCELSHISCADIYSRCWMEFASNVVQTEAPQFIDLGLPAVSTSDEFGILGNPATRIISPTDGSHWLFTDYIFGRSTAIGMKVERSDQDYSYKADFEIWRGNQDIGRQNISMSQPPLDSTTIGTNMTNITMS